MASPTRKNISIFQDKLLAWYDINGRSFPWRAQKLTPYEAIIAEVLLQRTKAETVSGFFSQFIKDFPNWLALSLTDTSSIEAYLKPIGLYTQRSKRLKSLAMEMVKRNDELPTNRAELESIPFMGQYIANAVELVIFNRPFPLLDVNMARLLERYFGERNLADIRYDAYLQLLAFKTVYHPRTKELNWAILDFAAAICRARSPQCQICILKRNCKYYASLAKTKRKKH